MATNNCVRSGFYSGESKLENNPPSPHLKPVMHTNRLGYVYSSTESRILAAVLAAMSSLSAVGVNCKGAKLNISTMLVMSNHLQDLLKELVEIACPDAVTQLHYPR